MDHKYPAHDPSAPAPSAPSAHGAVVGLEEGKDPELADSERRFWWTLPLTVVGVLLAMFGHSLGLMGSRAQTWTELALAAPVVLWAGARS
jgi:hypothetical protein